MRLRRLDLTRYGKFTGYSIDFAGRNSDGPDLHIVYGPNEAGKSTTLSAYLDLLFGIESGTKLKFLHPYDSMQIGAILELDGRTNEFIRIKRDLLDKAGRRVGEPAIAGHLGGISRESYRAMFSLDDDTLETGGQNILASKGDLGQLLFAASAGVADLSHALEKLRLEAEGFHKKSARTSQLATLKKRLAELKQERDQHDVAAATYAALVEARNRTLGQYQEAVQALAELKAQHDIARRRLQCLTPLAKLHAARTDLVPLAHLPDAPPGWEERLATLQPLETRLATQREIAETKAAGLVHALNGIVVDHAALEQANQLQRLMQLKPRHETALVDIPARQQEIAAEDQKIAGILARIGRPGDPDPHRLVLDTRTIGTFQDLIGEWSGVETATAKAAEELEKSLQTQDEDAARLRDAGGDPGTAPPDDASLAQLMEVIGSADDSRHALRHREALQEQAEQSAILTQQMATLLPWQGTAEALSQLQVPEPGDLEEWRRQLDSARKAHERAQEDAEARQAEMLRLQTQRDAITRGTGVVSDDEARTIRDARNAAWAEHRQRLDAATAATFEAALRRDDGAMEARLRHQSEVARLHQTNQDIAMAEVAAERARNALEAKAARLQQVRDGIAQGIRSFLPADTTLPQIEAWLRRRAMALESWAKQKQAGRDLRKAAADGEELRKRLSLALAAAGETPEAEAGAEALLQAAKARRDRANELKALWSALRQSEREVERRRKAHITAQQRQADWQKDWQAACSACWLRETGSPPTLATVQQALSDLPALMASLAARRSLLDRIGAMQADQKTFAAEAVRIAQQLGQPAEDDPLTLAANILVRVEDAKTAMKLQEKTACELKEAQEALGKLNASQEELETAKIDMTAHFGVTSLTDVAASLTQSQTKLRLQQQVAAMESEILETLDLDSIDDAEQVLAGADRATLETELQMLQFQIETEEQRTRELYSAHTRAVDQVEAVGGDEKVARIDAQRRTVRMQIEDGAVQYLRLRTGIVAAEYALRTYREQHRSSMLARASEAFSLISRGAYTGLASQPGRNGDDLIAVAAEGSTKLIEDLSKGARFQLYLALRVAGYYEFARYRSPVPFVADDILETFDDFRAEETFRLLAQMATVGQVIYLTHHLHLCDIARRICPAIRVHELAA